MAKVSVIVAVYKMPQYLPRCIEGILHQTHRNLELILVDDGSPDECGAICDGYAEKDSRVRVIHKENAGVCAARNTGLDWVYEHSDSEWIFFHDNDDWIHPETLERLLEANGEKGTMIGICGYQETEGEDPVIAEELLEPTTWTPADFYQQHFVNATVCWGKLYHRSVFEGKRYPEGKYIEDEFLTYRLLFAQETITVIPAALYAYFINPAGISKKTWQPKRLDAWEAYDQQIAFFEERGEENLVKFRLREYIDSGKKNLAAAMEAPNAQELAPVIAFMKKKLRKVIRLARRHDCIDFWFDYDLLQEVMPLKARVYRLWQDRVRRGKDG